MNFLNILLNFVMSLLLLTGQFSDDNTAAFRLNLSCSSSLQSNKMWSTVCSPFLWKHIGLSRILYLCTYDLILPCPVTIVVKFGVILIFNFNLSAILGKNDFVIAHFVVWSHSPCHFVTLCSLSSLNTALFESFCSTRWFLCWLPPLSQVVCQLVPVVSSVCLHPVEIYFPVMHLHFFHFRPDFFNEVCVVLPVFERF